MSLAKVAYICNKTPKTFKILKVCDKTGIEKGKKKKLPTFQSLLNNHDPELQRGLNLPLEICPQVSNS